MSQRTFGEIVGMEPVVPVSPHVDDIVVTEDGIYAARCDSYADCRGNYHSSDDDRNEADVEIVTEILNNRDEWIREYTTGNDDYADMYAHVMCEDRASVAHHIREWFDDGDIVDMVDGLINDGHIELPDDTDSWDYAEELVDSLSMNQLSDAMIDDCIDMMGYEYEGSEYAAYFGEGICLGSFAIDEYENQIDLTLSDELLELHDQGKLADIVACVDCECHVNMDGYSKDAKYPCIYTYHYPGGQWQFIVDYETAYDIAIEKLLDILRP